MQEIERMISEKYDLEIKGSLPYRDCCIINTQKGRKIVKKSSLPSERILFIHGAKEHLFENGFKNTDRYICTNDGSPCVFVEDSNYTLSDVITGNECNFEDRTDVIKASKLLASMHKASKGYRALPNSMPRNELGKLPSYFIKRLEDIKKLRKSAKKGRSSFDYLFLDYVNYFCDLGENSLKALEDSNYQEQIAAAEREGGFCHHDFTQYNLTFTQDESFISNFENSSL
jgi:spore coat protein I